MAKEIDELMLTANYSMIATSAMINAFNDKLMISILLVNKFECDIILAAIEHTQGLINKVADKCPQFEYTKHSIDFEEVKEIILRLKSNIKE